MLACNEGILTFKFALKELDRSYIAYINFCTTPSDLSFLHPEEEKYLQTLTYEKRKKSYLSGRFSAKQAISALGQEKNLERIVIKNGVFRQPLIQCEAITNTYVTLAHCDDLAVSIAYPDRMIMGIDVEKLDSESSGIACELTTHEKKIIEGEERLLYLIWTMKESLSKCLKTGLTIPLSLLEVHSIEKKETYCSATFTHFFQYRTLTWVANNYVFSITYPKNLHIDINLPFINECLCNNLNFFSRRSG